MDALTIGASICLFSSPFRATPYLSGTARNGTLFHSLWLDDVHVTEDKRSNVTQRQPPGRTMIPTEEILFGGRSEAAQTLSISCRALDYLIGKKQLDPRRIGSRVLIPMPDLLQFCRSDYPAYLIG